MQTIPAIPPMPTIKEVKEDEDEQGNARVPHIIKPATMTASDILTMDTMMNMEAYTKYLKRKQLTSGIKDQSDANERKFYRRRILDLTKEMFRGGHRAENGTNSTGVESAFETYIRACIMHFKFIDLADVLQTEYAGMNTAALVTTMPATAASDDDTISDFNKLCFNPNTTKLVKIKASTSNSLELLFIPAASDIDKDKAVDHNDNPVSFAPKTRDVNLMDEQFKMKGIKPRPKRSTPKSEE
jgi:hypothetical protein